MLNFFTGRNVLFITLLFLYCLLAPRSGNSCSLPDIYRSQPELLPVPVVERFCQPEPGYESLLLIRAAVSGNSPVFRIIATQRGGSKFPQKVRLYQFDKDGLAYPPLGDEVQDIVDFTGDYSKFVARVKNRKTTISFQDGQFCFTMHGLFGFEIKKSFNTDCRVTEHGRVAPLLFITTAKRKNWYWVLENGERVNF